MHLSVLEWTLSLGALVLQLSLLYVLAKKKLKSVFPFFFCYAAMQFFVLVLVLAGGPFLPQKVYFLAYWIVSAIMNFFAFAVLYEVFVNVLKPFSALIDLSKLLFCWAGVFLLIASVLTAVATTGYQADRLCAAVLLLERSVKLMQCGMLLLFVLFESRLGFSWRSRGMSIALVLGVTAAIDETTSLLSTRFPAWTSTLTQIDVATYFAAWAIWLAMFILPSVERRTAQESPKRLILQRWNEALVTYGYGEPAVATGTVESFLPGIEKTVDRVLARKIAN